MTSKQTSSPNGKSLASLIQYYEICNKCEGKSPKPILFYTSNLRHFQSYIKSRHLPDSINKIDINLLRDYVVHLMNRKKYPAHPFRAPSTEPVSIVTVHCHVRALRAFFSWLHREGFINENIGSNLKPPRIPNKIISTLSNEEIRAVLNSFNQNSPTDFRNKTIFMILIDSGLRIGELVNLKMAGIKQDGTVLHVMGKGRKERIVPIGINAQKVLQKYLFRYRPQPVNPGFDHVFLSQYGQPLTENGIKLAVKRVARASGVNRLHAHLCRHTFATRFLSNGGDIFTLQQILGHSTPEMVRHYANVSSSQVLLQHQKCSPLDRWGLR
jgi:site-specific recombinase XerD